jgi:hypothetical protein
VEIAIADASTSPFEVGVGFVDSTTLPSADVQVSLSVRALLRCPIQVQQISVVISHSQTGSSEFGIFGATELVASKILKCVDFLKGPRPGTLKIEAVVIYLGNVQLNIRTFAVLGSPTVRVLPLHAECRFSIVRLDFGIVEVPYPIRIVCDNIPRGTATFSLALNLNASEDIVRLIGTEHPGFVAEVVEWPPESVEWTIQLVTSESAEVTIDVPFKVTFKLFNSARARVALKQPTTVVPSAKYVLVATFNCHLPVRSAIQELRAVPEAGVEMKQIPFDLPLDISPNEAFTTACFFSTGQNTEPHPIGRFDVGYCPAGYHQTLSFSFQMPDVEAKESAQ